MKQRFLTVIVLVPILTLVIVLGGWVLALFLTALMAVGAYEYWRLFQTGGYSPSRVVLVGGTTVLLLVFQLFGFSGAQVVLGLVILLAMGLGVFAYERGGETPASDFAITVGGVLYLGWLACYVLAMRRLPDGQWWMLTAFPAIWFADGGAYLIGSRLGRHKMAPRTSPKKSWEGYIGGIVVGALATMLLAGLWGLRAPEITLLRGLVLGAVISTLAPLGDLGESMLKRQFNQKDSGALFPGHGGALDRADSSLWAAIIGYLIITLFWL